MNLIPPGDTLIVEVQNEEVITKSGIIASTGVPQENPHDSLKALVIYAGRKADYVKNGDYILFEQRWSAPCSVEGVSCKVISEAKILGVIYSDDEKLENMATISIAQPDGC